MGDEQGLGGMGAEDLPLKSRVNEVGDPADMIDVGVGQKEIVDLIRWNGKLIKGGSRGRVPGPCRNRP